MYACADGVVTFAGVVGGTWGSLVVIRHAGGVWSRYGHVTDILVQKGDMVKRGQQIARIGNAGGKVPYHLHFDLAITDVLERDAKHWPGMDRESVRRNYTDPRQYIRDHRPLRPQTPYSDKMVVWHWKGSSVPNTRDFSALLHPYRQFAPRSVGGLVVKVSDGGWWMASFDTHPVLRIAGPQDVQRWKEELERERLQLHIWAVVKGDGEEEARPIIEAARLPGVRSVILDVEPFAGFWKGTEQDVHSLMTVLRAVLGQMHIGISVDPRRSHFAKIFPHAWGDYVDSIHPQCYWGIMGRPSKDVLEEAFAVWFPLNRPICPVLQAHDVPAEEVVGAAETALSLGASGVSLWRTGVIVPTTLMALESWFVQK